jgi:hypothetical protein
LIAHQYILAEVLVLRFIYKVYLTHLTDEKSIKMSTHLFPFNPGAGKLLLLFFSLLSLSGDKNNVSEL